MFKFEKQIPVADAECPQESSGANCFSVRVQTPQEITFDCMMSPLSVML